ncbi:MAG TPA: cyclic nucleotide-binding domain-containing protein [Candidatus Hydrogenedentes bacterium]|nr:cyclic nucleotide-binding domain-containing protein [Candidatus Hydrogenedentota bacterium]
MSDMRRYETYAQKIKLFSGLTPEEVSEVLQLGSKLEFRAGDSIFHKGQLGSNLFIVLHGMVNITIDRTVIGKCRPGDAFGEMSVLNHRPHCASADAATDVKLFTLDERQINSIFEKHVAVRLLLNIIHTLSSHLEKANRVNSKNAKLVKELEGDKEEVATE